MLATLARRSLALVALPALACLPLAQRPAGASVQQAGRLLRGPGPAGFEARAGGSCVRLSWSDSLQDELGYAVERRPGGPGDFQRLARL